MEESMTEQELRRLSRKELLEMLIMQSEELESTKKKLANTKSKLLEREITIDNAGSIAEAALQVNGVFEAAQKACEQYIDNIKNLSKRQEVICVSIPLSEVHAICYRSPHNPLKKSIFFKS